MIKKTILSTVTAFVMAVSLFATPALAHTSNNDNLNGRWRENNNTNRYSNNGRYNDNNNRNGRNSNRLEERLIRQLCRDLLRRDQQNNWDYRRNSDRNRIREACRQILRRDNDYYSKDNGRNRYTDNSYNYMRERVWRNNNN